MDETDTNTTQDEAARDPGLSPLVPVTAHTNLKDIRTATDATISPDGKRATFVVWEWVPDKPRQRARIWTAETDGSSEARPFTKGARGDTCPRWSPDSRQLAFISRGDGEK